MSTWGKIKAKALICIDEAYPDSNGINASFFPVDEFIDEAARWVVRAVPLRALGEGSEIPIEGFKAEADGSGSIVLPSDFSRLIRFRIKGWSRPVLVPIYDTDPRYAQQFNPVLRGGEAKPVAVICENSCKLEYYSSSQGPYAKLQEARYFGFSSMGNDYPIHLVDVTAWKLAELVLTTMNDQPGIQLCAARIGEIMQTL